MAAIDTVKIDRLAAELAVLELYDWERQLLGHDYGNGQRWNERLRRRRELEHELNIARIYDRDVPYVEAAVERAPRDLKLRAYRRIAASRMRRYQRDAHLSETAGRALEAWRAVERRLEAEL